MIDLGNYKVSKEEYEKDKENLMNYYFKIDEKRVLINSIVKLKLIIEFEGYYPGKFLIVNRPNITGSTVDWSSIHSTNELKISPNKRVKRIEYTWDLKTSHSIGSFKIGKAVLQHHNQIYKTNEIIYKIEGGKNSLKLHKT